MDPKDLVRLGNNIINRFLVSRLWARKSIMYWQYPFVIDVTYQRTHTKALFLSNATDIEGDIIKFRTQKECLTRFKELQELTPNADHNNDLE